MILIIKINKHLSTILFIMLLVFSSVYIYIHLQPVEVNTGKIEFVVVIDPGHGSIDTGTYFGNIYEKDINLQVARILQDYLRQHNIVPVLTRNKDELYNRNRSDDLRHRPRIAKEYNADLFISLHVNNFPTTEAAGSQVFYKKYSPVSRELASKIKTKLITINPDNDREIKRGDFYVLNNSPCTAVLIEMGFLSNPGDREKLQNPSYQQTMATAIGEGIIDHLQNQLINTEKQQPEPVTTGLSLQQKKRQIYYIQKTTDGLRLTSKNYSYPTGLYLQTDLSQMSSREIIIRTALKQLTQPPGDLIAIFPTEKIFKSIRIEGDKATIDLAEELLSTCNWGAERELMTLIALERTMLSMPGLNRLEILVEGQNKSTLSGHIIQ